MNEAQIPSKFQVPFGADAGGGYITVPIPLSSIVPNRASLQAGFPPSTDQPGGAPAIQDFNGILNMLSAWAQWFQAGGPIVYDAAFQSEIGGYPNGAVIQSATTPHIFWQSTADANTTNPDASGAGWVDVSAVTAQANAETYAAAQAAAALAAAESYTNAAVAPLAPKASPALTGTPTAPTAAPLTSNTQIATTAYADAAVAAAASVYVESTPVSLGALTSASFNHGFSSTPKGDRYGAYLLCVTANCGFSPGDVVHMPATTYTGAGGGTASFFFVAANATQVFAGWNNPAAISIYGPSGTQYLTPVDWEIVLYARSK